MLHLFSLWCICTQTECRERFPALTGLTELGFHWRVCVDALSASGGDVEQAANALFTMENPSEAVEAWEVSHQHYNVIVVVAFFTDL